MHASSLSESASFRMATNIWTSVSPWKMFGRETVDELLAMVWGTLSHKAASANVHFLVSIFYLRKPDRSEGVEHTTHQSKEYFAAVFS